ncbi:MULTISPECIES: hypothetical protein [Nocardia]|uniref:hypothetical protein n=1 Tax=Nocardia TaxID=1817 RepID=UPI0018E4DF96|nr:MULTISPECIES: hypothetical protein [Nocardia]
MFFLLPGCTNTVAGQAVVAARDIDQIVVFNPCRGEEFDEALRRPVWTRPPDMSSPTHPKVPRRGGSATGDLSMFASTDPPNWS